MALPLLAVAKGVGSMFPKNTIVNKISTGGKITAKDITNAVSDVKKSATAIKNKDWTNVVTLPSQSKVNTGSAKGIGSLAPNKQQTASAIIQQEKINNALANTSVGRVQPTLNLTNAGDYSLSTSTQSLSDPVKGEFPAWLLLAGIGAYFLLK